MVRQYYRGYVTPWEVWDLVGLLEAKEREAESLKRCTLSVPCRLISCKERHDLAGKVSDAVNALYAARHKYEAARDRKSSDTAALHDALATAREVECKAAKTLRIHVESHGCRS